MGASHAREGACGGRLRVRMRWGPPLAGAGAGAGTGGGDLRRVGSRGSWGGMGEGAMEGSPRGLGASGARPPDTAQRGDRGVTPGQGAAGCPPDTAQRCGDRGVMARTSVKVDVWAPPPPPRHPRLPLLHLRGQLGTRPCRRGRRARSLVGSLGRAGPTSKCAG